MMSWICVVLGALAALCLYLASPHQNLWRHGQRNALLLRCHSVVLLIGAIVSTAGAYGLWCSLCIALAGFMVSLVMLPYLNASVSQQPSGEVKRNAG
ncbi:hypothetical protein [Janthinobacterium sp. PC23-8]|uniref:hypothetical protein n=1 Tax=Janthinobacterium sp. PC23-8 TaxID=2012679 RepID=UPI0020CF4FFE|nr:hypothetical protein [Janthinobacterium sp. PC23-8]